MGKPARDFAPGCFALRLQQRCYVVEHEHDAGGLIAFRWQDRAGTHEHAPSDLPFEDDLFAPFIFILSQPPECGLGELTQ